MTQFYGKYRAKVVDVSDPERRGRIRVNCPAVLGSIVSTWALPCFAPNTFSIPKVGELVWVEFERGEKDKPIWIGVFYTPERRGELFPDAYVKNIILLGDVKTDNVYMANVEMNNAKAQIVEMNNAKAQRYEEKGVKVALVGYPIEGTGYMGTSVTGVVKQG